MELNFNRLTMADPNGGLTPAVAQQETQQSLLETQPESPGAFFTDRIEREEEWVGRKQKLYAAVTREDYITSKKLECIATTAYSL